MTRQNLTKFQPRFVIKARKKINCLFLRFFFLFSPSFFTISPAITGAHCSHNDASELIQNRDKGNFFISSSGFDMPGARSLFGEKVLYSLATDIDYYSYENEQFLQKVWEALIRHAKQGN